MKDKRPGRCRYCGAAAMLGPTCSRCRELEAEDPSRLAELGPLGEHELGVEIPWPEGEAADRGGEG